MTPTFKISLAERIIKQRVQRLEVVDRSGFAGDTLTFELRADRLAIPKTGVLMHCEIGYAETGTWDVGSYYIEDLHLKGSPPVLTLRGISQPQGNNTIAALQTTDAERVWQPYAIGATTFETVVTDVCAAVGLVARVDDRLAGLQMPLTTQTSESDAAFLHRITTERNGIVKMDADAVIFELRDTGRLGSVDIAFDASMAYAFDLSERYNIDKVRVKYQDVDRGETRTLTLGDGKGLKIVPRVFPNRESAQAAAETLLKHYKRDYQTATIRMPTIPGLLAEKFVNLSGFPGETQTNGQYVCVFAKHVFSEGGGLVSELRLKRPQRD